MARLDTDLETMEYDDVITGAGPYHKSAIKLTQGKGVLKRGTVVTGTAGEGLAPVSAALSGADALDPVYILCEDTDTGDSGSSTVVAFAYDSGEFLKERLATDGEYTLADADFAYMRVQGFRFKSIIEKGDADA